MSGIKTTTTIRGSRVGRYDISQQLQRTAELVTEAVEERGAQGIAVQFSGTYADDQPATQDRVEAKVTVTE